MGVAAPPGQGCSYPRAMRQAPGPPPCRCLPESLQLLQPSWLTNGPLLLPARPCVPLAASRGDIMSINKLDPPGASDIAFLFGSNVFVSASILADAQLKALLISVRHLGTFWLDPRPPITRRDSLHWSSKAPSLLRIAVRIRRYCTYIQHTP